MSAFGGKAEFIFGMTANARHAMTRRRHCGMINRLWNTFAAAALIAVTLIGADAWAQTSRTIRIVVPFPPGGSADILARLLGEHISKAQGPTVIVENRPGGGASIAYEAVARAAPDGNVPHPCIRASAIVPGRSVDALRALSGRPPGARPG